MQFQVKKFAVEDLGFHGFPVARSCPMKNTLLTQLMRVNPSLRRRGAEAGLNPKPYSRSQKVGTSVSSCP